MSLFSRITGKPYFVRKLSLVITMSCLGIVPGFAQGPHIRLASLSENSREIFLVSMTWGDQYYDPQIRLLRQPVFASSHPQHYLVRESTWYALGLLLRDQPGDRYRAVEILRTVLKEQYNEPDKPWDGTFRRSPEEEPEPSSGTEVWRTYDPNLREFVGTTFSIILKEYSDRIPPDVARSMDQAIDRAVAGEMKQHRLVPSYTNIALMYGYLWDFAGVRSKQPSWVGQAAQWQDSVYKLFKKHDAFFEYNSPTYSGTDLYALALWQLYGSTPRMRSMGNEMDASLWRSVAAFYNANLRNISGPYDRAYGMDMQRYVSVVGLWLRTVLDANSAPLPKFDPPVDHVGDLWFVSQIAVLGTTIPADAIKNFRSFQGERLVFKRIDDHRIATAWIGKELIYGGEITEKTKDTSAHNQFHPVTAQWSMLNGKVGWIQLTRSPPIDASADKRGIVISTSGDVQFRIYAPEVPVGNVKPDEWILPGLTVHVNAGSKGFHANRDGDYVDVDYPEVTKMTLTFEHAGD